MAVVGSEVCLRMACCLYPAPTWSAYRHGEIGLLKLWR